MTIRKKILFILTAAIVILTVCMYSISALIQTRQTGKIEMAAAEQNVNRAMAAINQQIDVLDKTATDYAGWDDTCAFVDDLNSNYIDSNLSSETYANNRYTFMVFVNAKGQVVYSRAYDLEKAEEVAVDAELMNVVARSDLLKKHEDTKSRVKGILMLRAVPYLIASRPILTSQYRGPIRGALIVGRPLKQEEIDELAEITDLPLHLTSIDDPEIPDEVRNEFLQLGADQPVRIQQLSPSVSIGYGLILDIFNQPTLIARVYIPRDYHLLLLTNLKTLLLSLVLTGVIIGLIVFVLINQLMLSRLSRLHAFVQEVDKSENLSARVELPGTDEISVLGRALNKMMDTLERDITERVWAEDALRESEHRFRAVLENVSLIAVILDPKGNVFFCNEALLQLTSWDLDEIIGKNWFEMFLPSDRRQKIHEIFETAISSGYLPVHAEYEIVTRAGLRRTISWSNTLLRDNEGKVFGATSIGEDITERRRVEADRNRLAAAIEQAAEAVMITDRNGLIEYANPAFEKITGYSRLEVIGQTPRMLKSDKQSDSVYRQLWETLVSGKNWSGHFINKCKDNRLVEVDETISPVFDDTKHIAHFVSVMRDVTQLVALENQVRQAQKMEAVGTMAGGIAHDFNNILAAIRGYADLLKLTLPKDSRALPNVDEIIHAAKRARDLIKQILIFSRRTEPEQELIQLQEVIRETRQLLRSSTPLIVKVKESIDDACGPVLADPTQMQQIIMNLCTNAFYAMRNSGGILEISLKEIAVHEELAKTVPNLTPGHYACLSLTDTGEGMNQATIERIFEPFFTTKPVGEGTGLGLSVVLGIVQRHKGAMTVSSEVGKGTRFTIYLPVAVGSVSSEEHAIEQLPRGSGRILLVDDEPKLVNMERESLQYLGYVVTPFTDSREALEAFTNKPDGFDVVVTDQMMPGLTGTRRCVEIRKIRPDVPVILCSGYSDHVTDEETSNLNINEFLAKPISISEMAVALHQALKSNTPNTP